MTAEAVTRQASQYEAQAPDTSIRAFRDEVLAAIGNKNLVDVRSPDEFSGKILAPAHLPQEQAQRAGHITSAINVPWSRAANEDGTFKSDEDLTAIYAHAGLDGSQPTIAYCRIGERSSHTWFVLRELLEPRGREELRRQLDRIRFACWCSYRVGRWVMFHNHRRGTATLACSGGSRPLASSPSSRP